MGTVVFDLDGTLADTSADLIAAANTTLASFGHPPQLDPVLDAATAGRGARAMLSLAQERLGGTAQADLVEAGFPVLLRAYGEKIDTYTKLYPGARECLEALRAAGHIVSVCTNKPERLARELLSRLGVLELFGAMIGADTLPTRKPDPAPYFAAVHQAGGDPKHSFLVGDTLTDRETARAAGVASVLVTFGPNGQSVAALQPEALLDHFDALPALTQQLLGD
ncbi:MAG: HAD-IA family hydrolase [Mangrovicoccus sp.]|nr:HAD-IA family hydrolase [Mangrovicoccus sp.]